MYYSTVEQRKAKAWKQMTHLSVLDRSLSSTSMLPQEEVFGHFLCRILYCSNFTGLPSKNLPPFFLINQKVTGLAGVVLAQQLPRIQRILFNG